VFAIASHHFAVSSLPFLFDVSNIFILFILDYYGVQLLENIYLVIWELKQYMMIEERNLKRVEYSEILSIVIWSPLPSPSPSLSAFSFCFFRFVWFRFVSALISSILFWMLLLFYISTYIIVSLVCPIKIMCISNSSQLNGSECKLK